MARGKKKESTLTPEEKLAQTLVPVEEQPYMVPENWCWANLGSYIDYATDYVANGSFASLKENVKLYKEENYALMVKTADFANGFTESLTYTDEHGYNYLSKSVLTGGELILSNIGSIGKVFRVPYFNCPMTLASNSVMIKCHDELDYDWLYYFFLSPIGLEELLSITTGTAMLKFNKTDLKGIALPIPPKTEQQRIVDRIDYLFAKLDEAKEKAQSVLDSFETRKAAILHKAFTGELTAKWRAEHGLDMGSWATRSLKNCGSWYGGGTPSTTHPEYWENGTLLWITSKDMKSDLIEDTLMHTTMLGVENSSANYIEEPAVLFVMRSGILRRTFPVCMVKKPFTVNQDLKALVPNDIDLEYLFWACKAAEKEILEKCMKSGTTVESINASALQNFLIPVAGKEEQSEIVHILDSLFAKEQQAKDAAEAVLEKIELLKKSILARAFRGELGTNNPNEESAIELLKQVL